MVSDSSSNKSAKNRLYLRRISAPQFYADPHQISFPDLPQSKRQQMILNEAPPTFFQKHKKTLLWTVLGLVTVSAAISMSGKKVVIDSSAF